MNNYFMGQDGFSWFIGVVEDRNDPWRVGRGRVRCLGHHSEDVNDIPTAELPWATPMMPVTAGANSGIGVSPHFLIEGTWVVGFFRDPAKQEPVIMGALPGFNTTETTNQTIASSSKDGGQSTKGGFKDPRDSSTVAQWRANIYESGLFPREAYIGKPDTNILATGDAGHDCHNADLQKHDGSEGASIDARAEGAEKYADGTEGDWIEGYTKPFLTRKTWLTAANNFIMEPLSGIRNSKYPFNHVLESESGHFVQFDDTEGNERILIYHRKGTFVEIDKDSNVVIKATGNITNIVAGSMDTYIHGNYSLTVDGNMEVRTTGGKNGERVGNYTEKIYGDRKTTIMQSETVLIGGAVNKTYEDVFNLVVAGEVTKTFNDKLNETVKLDVTETYKANQTTKITGMLDIAIEKTGTIKSDLAMVVGGSSISFN